MPCYRPNYMMFVNGESSRFGGKLTDNILKADLLPGQSIVPIPCGKCVGCRTDKAKAWADRMLLEFDTDRDGVKRKALFLTLTYDESHCPWITGDDGIPYRSLSKRDPTLFLKVLRKAFPNKRLRYYLAAEYGTRTFRPHYHAIIYGLGLDDFPDGFIYSTSSEEGSVLYESPVLDSLWSRGAVRYSAANYHTFGYVARYVIKKQYVSDGGDSFYRGRVAPFNRMSRKPGLGSDYFKDVQFSHVYVPDFDEVHKIAVPRCVMQKLQLTDPVLYDNIMSTRRYVADQRSKLIEDQTDLTWLQNLRLQETEYIKKIKKLQCRDYD